MAKKKSSLSTVVAFMSSEAQAQLAAAENLAGTLPLAEIRPDPGQPRRLLPDGLAAALAAGHLTPVEALQAWLDQAGDPTIGRAGRGEGIQELKRLAESIARHGLINPISVRLPRPGEAAPPGVNYLVVTGERRYWACVYLLSQGRTIQEGETSADPAQVKATLTAPGVTIRAHQLIENLLREDINAVERAQGLWALRYELSGVETLPGRAEETTMVNHGSPSPEAALVPWARVEEVLGISKRYRIFAASVLELDPAALALVRQHRLTERAIRPIVQKLKGRPDLQVQALEQLLAWQAAAGEDDLPPGGLVAALEALVEALLAAGEIPPAAPLGSQPRLTRSVSSAPVVRFGNKVRQTLDFLNRLKPNDRAGLTEHLGREEFAEIMLDLRNLRQQLDVLLEAAGQEQPDT